MRKATAIDYARLLGFASVSDQLSGSVDFRDENLGAKLGAKVGDKFWAARDLPCGSQVTGEPDPSAAHSRCEDTEA